MRPITWRRSFRRHLGSLDALEITTNTTTHTLEHDFVSYLPITAHLPPEVFILNSVLAPFSRLLFYTTVNLLAFCITITIND